MPPFSSWFFLGVIWLAGYVVVSLVWGGGKRSGAQILGLSAAMGGGVLSYVLLLLSLGGVKPSRTVILLLALGLTALALWLWKNEKLTLPRRSVFFPGEAVKISGVGLLGLAFFFVVAVIALAHPFYDWDSFTIFAFKAKVLTTESLTPKPAYFYDATVSFSHLDYPLLVPMLIAGEFTLGGKFDETAGMMIFPFIYAAFGWLVYGALRWKLPRVASALITVLMLSLPALVRWANTGTADVAVALFYAGSIFHLIKWMEEKERPDLVLGLFFSVWTALTKNEGLGLVLINGMVLSFFTIFRRDKQLGKGLVLFGLGFALLYAPWWAWNLDTPRLFEDYGSKLNLANVMENNWRLFIIVPEFAGQVLRWDRWGIFWILLLLAALFGRAAFRTQPVRALWLIFGAHVAMYVIVFVVTPWNVQQLMGSILDRILLHTLPAATLLLGYHGKAAGLFSQRDGDNRRAAPPPCAAKS